MPRTEAGRSPSVHEAVAPTQFALSSMFAGFLLLALSFSVFGVFGVAVGPALLGIVVYVRSAKSPGQALGRLALASLGLLLLSCLIVPAVAAVAVRAEVRRSLCGLYLHQIHGALCNYRDSYVRLPPVEQRDSSGKPMHSWRVLVLPFVDEENLYRQYDFSEPWDGPKNRNLAGSPGTAPSAPFLYQCPSAGAAFPPSTTSYLAVVGPDGDWLDQDVPGPRENPVRVIEVYNSDTTWMERRDISLEELCRPSSGSKSVSISSNHQEPSGFFHDAQPMGAQAVFADGSVRLIPSGVSADVLRAALAGDRKKQTELVPNDTRKVNWPNCASLASLVTVFLLTLVWPRRKASRTTTEERSKGSVCL
ncbi:MAG: DUF1559 domain-containing protein [Pirellulales bacterium]|nr:DUF1559 domain-containing protein [Pirellulales bacterium]